MTGPEATGSPQAQEPAQASAAPPPEPSAAPPPPPPSAPAGYGTSTTLPPGPLEGTTVAEFVPRLVAFIIDGIIVGIVGRIAWFLFAFLPFGLDILVLTVASIAITAGYFVYFWPRRQTPGMSIMKLLIVQDDTGQALTQDQAIRRFIYLGLPWAVTQLLSFTGFAISFSLGLGILLWSLASLAAIVALLWELYLAYTTWQDPRKKGIHDKAVNSIVVSYGSNPVPGPR